MTYNVSLGTLNLAQLQLLATCTVEARHRLVAVV